MGGELFHDITGIQVGNIKVLGPAPIISKRVRKNGSKIWIGECQLCGSQKRYTRQSFKRNQLLSCGCQKKFSYSPNGYKRAPRLSDGYVHIFVKGHPNCHSLNRIAEHRYVMSEKLGRPLYKHEHVHHINGIRYDNRPENLELWSDVHPHGARVADLIEHAIKTLQQYAPDRLKE